MRTGKDYRIQTYWVYRHLGNGKILIKDYSDPDFVRESRFIVRVGVPFSIGFVNTPGRHYIATPVFIDSQSLILRIESIEEG